jgi:type IV pilus assembly protein PilQ
MNKKHWAGVLARAGAAAAVGFAALSAWAAPTIQAVTGAVQNGTEMLRIDFSEPPTALPAGVSIQSPARIALDFAGVVSSMPRTPVEINQGNLRSASVLTVGERSRVVLNLKQATAYKASLQGNSVLVLLEPVAAAQPAAATVFPDGGTQGRSALRDLDFRRGADNTGRVVVGLGSSQVGVDLRQQGQTLVVEFLNSSLPEGLRRRLDVADFDTPVQSISTFQVGDRVRMVIEPRGNWEHSAYQSEGQFVVEVRPQRVDPNRLSQGPSFSGEKLSLNFQSIEVRALLQVIADFTNFNVVTSDSVTGSVTLRLKDVPWDQALQIIMDAKGLGMEKSGTVLWIAPKDEIDARKKKDLEAAAALENLEPLRTQSFQMNYARAVDIAAQITNANGAVGAGANNSRFLSSRGTAIPEPRTNQLFVTDVASRLEAVNELIKKLDVAVRQVLIEARIVEASDTFGKSIGVRLGGGDLRAQRGGDGGYRLAGNNRVAFGSSYGNAVASSGMGGTVNTNSNFVNLPAIAQGNAESAASFAVSIFNAAANRFLSLELSALESDGKGKVVSSPRVVTADQTKALIEQGTELPYQVATSSGATSIAFRKANLKLEVTPQITPEGNIILDLDVNKDSVGQSTAAGFAINTKHIKTQVLVENGGTVVIGGIFELNEVEDVTKVPLLGDIPIAGNLFKTRTRTSNKQEMLIFITPKMIADRMAGR